MFFIIYNQFQMTEYKEILKFWFPNDNFNKFWFSADKNIDEYIKTNFFSTLGLVEQV